MLYLSGVAAAIGFRMNLFNIGVEGQYRVAAFAAACVRREAWLPGYLNTVAAILVAMAAGALWAGIAGVLRVTRGVSEVISTIMLNAIAGSLVAYLLLQGRRCSTGSADRRPSRSPRARGSAASACSTTSPQSSTGWLCWPSSSGVGFWVAARPDPLRLRPAGDRAVGVGGRRQRRQREADGASTRCCCPVPSPG